MKFISASEEDTVTFAKKIGGELQNRDMLLLYGSLGSGKTVFSRALIRALAGDPRLEVPSPTFTLLQTYDTGRGMVSHYDLYRLSDESELFELGWEDSITQGFTIVEWPERLGRMTPSERLDIRFSSVDNEPNSRLIDVTRISGHP